jgi:hypothetical protein
LRSSNATVIKSFLRRAQFESLLSQVLEPLHCSGSTLTAGEIGKRDIAAFLTFPMPAKRAFCVEENPKVCGECQVDQPSFAGNFNRRELDVSADHLLHATLILS